MRPTYVPARSWGSGTGWVCVRALRRFVVSFLFSYCLCCPPPPEWEVNRVRQGTQHQQPGLRRGTYGAESLMTGSGVVLALVRAFDGVVHRPPRR